MTNHFQIWTRKSEGHKAHIQLLAKMWMIIQQSELPAHLS